MCAAVARGPAPLPIAAYERFGSVHADESVDALQVRRASRLRTFSFYSRADGQMSKFYMTALLRDEVRAKHHALVHLGQTPSCQGIEVREGRQILFSVTR